MSFYQDHCIYLPAMVGWFVFSALLSSYNKYVFGSGHMAFPCPLLLTSLHFLVQWIFSWSVSAAFPVYFGGDQVAAMSWRPYLSTSIPCGLVTSGDVGLSNLSLVRISITFYTMVKASTPIFVLAWAYVLRIERITTALLCVVLIIACGEFLTVVGEVHFDLVGFLLCLSASLLSGARWTLVQLKLNTLEPKLKTTVATMRVLSPSMFFSMVVLSLCIERPWESLPGGGYFDTVGQGVRTIGMGLIGAAFAVAMVMCEFYLIMRANAIVLMIGGVIKEMITIIVGVEFFHDSLNRINVAGCLIVFSGVLLYKITYHLDKHGKGHEEDDGISGPIKYRHVNGSQTDVVSDDDDDEEEDSWIENVSASMTNGDSEKAYEMQSIGIQLELPKTRLDIEEPIQDDEDLEQQEELDSSMRHRIT